MSCQLTYIKELINSFKQITKDQKKHKIPYSEFPINYHQSTIEIMENEWNHRKCFKINPKKFI